MTTQPETQPQHQTLDEMAERMARMEKFITPRFDEISAEIHATCQLVDMAENGMSSKFSEILSVLSAITFSGSGNSPHNVGVELDAVVKTTEDAANQILDAAMSIAGALNAECLIDWNEPAARAQLFDQVRKYTDDILTACAFQDLTGQRIGKTLENIRRAEAELSEMLGRMGIQLELGALKEDGSHNPLPDDVQTPALANQDDIDALFK